MRSKWAWNVPRKTLQEFNLSAYSLEECKFNVHPTRRIDLESSRQLSWYHTLLKRQHP